MEPRPWLTEIRKEKELSLKALGELTTCSANHLCDIEKGRKNPSLQQACELAILLEFDIYKFYKGDVKFEDNCSKDSKHQGVKS